MIDGLLGQPHEDNIAKFFSALDGEYSMYGTGAPINGSRTLQAGTRFKQRELPPCLKDRYKVSKPLSVEGSGSPAKPDYFSGIGTVLPKFAYKNVYNPNEPRNVKDKELKDRVYNLGEPLDNYLVSAKDVRPDYMTGIIRPTKEDLYKDSPKCVKNVYSISKPVEIVTGGLPQNVYHYSETDKKLPEFAYNDN